MRRQFTDEFKREAVGLLASSGQPSSQIARELGIAASRLRSWRDTGDRRNAGSPRRSNTQAAIPPAGADLAAENARLRREVPAQKFRLIEDQRDRFSVRAMCDAMGVSPAGYYAMAWPARKPA